MTNELPNNIVFSKNGMLTVIVAYPMPPALYENQWGRARQKFLTHRLKYYIILGELKKQFRIL